MTTYTQEQLDKLYKNLPEELQEAIFSMETAEDIGSTCESYGIADNRVGEISDLVGRVLMGLLLPQEFAKALKESIQLPEVLAQAISQDINRLIFYPVKSSLESLHKIEVEASAKVTTPSPEHLNEQPREQKNEQQERFDDPYREELK